MKNLLQNFRKIGLLLITGLLISTATSAATFTAIASGNWSSTLTWGGTVPSLTNTIDQVTIPIGITVNMDNSVTLNGLLASLTVNGTLTANAGTTLTTTAGTIAGAGVITTDHAVFGVSAIFSFTGSFTTNTMSNWAATLQSSANIMVNQTLTLATGTLSIIAGGTLSTATNATIIDSAGALSISGGTLSLVNNYNVIYNGLSISTGLELSGTSTLNNLTVAVSGLSTVTLMSHVTVNGMLTLTSGVLALNAYDLHINGDVSASGSGTISSTITSNISLHSTTGITGTLNFTNGLNSVNNLTVDVGATYHARVHGTLLINGNLNLTSGIFSFNNSTITINGNVNGVGMLSGNATSNLSITTSGGLSGGLSFDANGQWLNNFTINVGSGNSVTLSSDLNVAGTLSLTGGSNIDISGEMLTLNGDLSGSGSFIVNSTSSLVLNASASLSSAVSFIGTVGNLTVNVGSLSSVMLGTNATIAGMLTLQNGTLDLNSNNLIINGDVSASGSGTISSTTSSNISLHSSTGITGTLNFTSGLNSVNNLTVDVGATYHARVHGTLVINGTLNLTSGIFTFNSSDITINGNVNGVGTLSGNATSNLSVTTTGGLSGGLSFDATGQSLNNFTINVGSGNSVILSTDLNIEGTLSLTGGSNINMSGVMLTLNGDLTGSGSFIVNSSSSLVLNSIASLSSTVSFIGTIGNLTVNVGSLSAVMLGMDATIAGTLTLQNGTLDLNSNNLTIMGDVSATGTGMISTSSSSNIFVTTSASLSGALRFSSTNNTVNNFTLNIGGNGNATLGTDLVVNGILHFTSGTISTGSNTLHIGVSGTITGAGTTSYVITGAGGSLAMYLTGGDTTGMIFHVGTSVRYYPARVVLNVGSNSGNIMVSAVDHVWANGTSGINLSTDQALVDATWLFNTDITSNLNLNMWLMWEASAEINGFDRTHAYISHYTSGAWDFNAISSATVQGSLYAMERMNVTSFSPFAVFDQSTSTGVPVAKTSDIEVYPNPSSDYIFIKNSFSADDNVFVDVVDDFGQVVSTYRITSDNTSIPLNGLSEGNYILKVYNDKMNTVIKKIVKL